jgi:hypothetical protein
MTIPTLFDRPAIGALKCLSVLACAAALSAPGAVQAQDPAHDGTGEHQPHLFAAADFGIDPTTVTFNKDIAPILERSCIGCHRAGGAAPMSFASYP